MVFGQGGFFGPSPSRTKEMQKLELSQQIEDMIEKHTTPAGYTGATEIAVRGVKRGHPRASTPQKLSKPQARATIGVSRGQNPTVEVPRFGSKFMTG